MRHHRLAGNAPWVITVGASSHSGTVLRQDDTIADSARAVRRCMTSTRPDLIAPGHGIVSLSDPVSLFYVKAHLLGRVGIVYAT